MITSEKLGLAKPTSWHKRRQKYIGGSDIAAVLGLSKWKTPLQVYEEKTAENPAQENGNTAMEFGLIFENPLADYYTHRTGLKVIRSNKPVVHKDHPFLAADLDRKIVGAKRGPGVLEIKTTTYFVKKAWDDQIPIDQYCQLQYQLACSGYNWGDVGQAVLDKREFHIIPFERDQEFIDLMIFQAVEFWQNHVLKGIPPEPINTDDLHRINPVSVMDKSVAAPDTALAAVSELMTIKDAIKNLENQKKAFEFKLQNLMRDAEVLTYQDDVLATWKTYTQERLDSKRLKADKPEIFREYVKESSYRRFIPKNL